VSAAPSRAERARRGDRLIEVIAVLLLGVATLGSAWCGYQATRWNSQEADDAQAATDVRVEASRLFGLATQQVAYDSAIIAQFAQAYVAGNQQLTDFYLATLIRPSFLPVIEKWEAQIRAGDTPTNLLQDEEYIDAQFGDYTRAQAEADALTAKSQEASETSDKYVLTTLLLASALFFAGVTTSFRMRFPRLMLLVASGLIIAYAASRLAALHVT
jgi:hypothetical protein